MTGVVEWGGISAGVLKNFPFVPRPNTAKHDRGKRKAPLAVRASGAGCCFRGD